MSPCDDSKLSECSAEIAPFHLLQEKKINKKIMPGNIMSNFQGRRVKEVLHSGQDSSFLNLDRCTFLLKDFLGQAHSFGL